MLPGPFSSQAAVALTGGYLVKVAGDGTVGPTSAITDEALGTVVIDAAPNAGVNIKPLAGGVHEVYCSAAVTAGQVVEPSTTPGYVKVRTTGTRVGVALTTASGSPLRCKILG